MIYMVSHAEKRSMAESSGHAADVASPDDCDVEAMATEESPDIEPISNNSCPRFHFRPSMTILFFVLILVVGGAASAAFIAIGITASDQSQAGLFDSRSMEIASSLESSWMSYEVAGLTVHEAARSRNISRKEFRELYEYIKSTGLVFQVTSFNPNVTNAERPALEEESRQFYADNYPDLVPDYQGIVGLEPNDPKNGTAGTSIQPRSEQAYYFPVHLLEPIQGNVGAIDFDLYSSPSRRETIHLALETWLPALTPRLRLVQETDPSAYSVILLHPGVPLTTTPNLQPKDLSSMVIRIPDLLRDAIKLDSNPTTVFLFDTTDKTLPNAFLGGASSTRNGQLIFEEENTLEGVRQRYAPQKQREIIIDVASSEWVLLVVAVDGTYEADNKYIILGGAIIMAACVILAVWLATSMRQLRIQANLKQKAETEKAQMIIQNAQRVAQSERDLNDFIAHEVRNPLSAAMSACSFISSSLTEEIQPLMDNSQSKTNLESALEDTRIISSSLQFINELLRNMLDMHQASANQLTIEMNPTDILHDVFLPVEAMLYSRGTNFEIQTECPDTLAVLTDRLRLKQIALNLARNSVKFVEKGFVRLRAAVVDNKVHIYIEDSGPGIPNEKRHQLFAKFQKSLDSLHQGTGIGLSLCLDLATLMGAEIWYDESYDSGIVGCPGARFVINLNVPPLNLDDHDLYSAFGNENSVGLDAMPAPPNDVDHTIGKYYGATSNGSSVPLENGHKARVELPEKLKVLFCDDDLVLRKLFCRGLRQVAPGWDVSEASNGESVLRMLDDPDCDKQRYDIIFIDQYMASVDKQLLGTETVVAIRARGVNSIICGLSANDSQQAFLDSGANAFMMKPFPCEKGAMVVELTRVIQSCEPLRSKT